MYRKVCISNVCMVAVAPQCKMCLMPLTVHLKMVRMIKLTFCTFFYHNFLQVDSVQNVPKSDMHMPSTRIKTITCPRRRPL